MNQDQRDCLRSFLYAPHPYENTHKLYAYVESLIAAEREDAERYRYMKDMDDGDKLRLIASGTDNWDAAIDAGRATQLAEHDKRPTKRYAKES